MVKRIAYITDVHLDEIFTIDQKVDARENWSRILKDISLRGIDEIVFGGDIGEESANQWFFNTLENFSLDLSLGNHDQFEEVIKHNNISHLAKQSEWYYSKPLGNYKGIFLDSSSELISNEQFEWFKKELGTSKSIILFIHHPILAVKALVDKQYALIDRVRLKSELLKLENEVTIFCGHYHFDDETKEANIHQYISPAASHQVEKLRDEIKVNNRTFGYRILELHENEIKTKLVNFS